MTTIVKHSFIYHPEKKQTEIKTEANNWEGVPANLIPNVMDILRHPMTYDRVIKLHQLSPVFFHNGLIAQVVGVTTSTVSIILSKYYQSL